MTIKLRSILQCPACGFKVTEQMPVDYCLVVYTCGACQKVMKPLPGDCCVFCSYGSIKCPPVQQQQLNCSQ